MKRKEEAMKKYIASFLAICMIFVMVPILPAEAAGLEDTERVEILELVESYMDSRETAVMTGDTESLRTVAVNGIVNDENAHRITLSENNVSVSDPSSTTYDYIWGAFFSSCSGNGTKDHSTQPALKAVSCTDIATGAGGHRYGLCQMGAALRAKNGDSASNILLYYYTDCRIISRTLK